MSNPHPFGSPFYGEEEDFPFPISEAPHDPSNNNPTNPFVTQEINPNSLPNSSISISSQCQYWSMFLDQHDDQDFPLITGQIPTTSQEIPNDWLPEIDDHTLDDLEQQGAPGSSSGTKLDHNARERIRRKKLTTSYSALQSILPDSKGAYYKEIPNDWPQETDDHTLDDLVQQDAPGSSSRTKLDHNARERIRRKKLTTSYSALQSILPDSKRSYYKRWTAPYILDRALDYIPKLEAEIEKLTLEKGNLLSQIGKQQQEEALQREDKRVVNRFRQTLTVSINEVKTGELIIQICQQKGILDHKISTLVEKLEREDIRVMGASSQCASEDRSCFHLHVQMGETRVEADYVGNLQKKLINWLS